MNRVEGEKKVQHKQGWFRGCENLNLCYRYWLPESDIKAVLVIAHGVAEHGGRYMNLVNYLVPRGYAVYGFDYRGHGRSEGKRGHVERFSCFPDDLRAFIDLVRTWNPGKNIFLFGHSMGAAISLEYAIRHQDNLAGLILSGAAIRVKPRLPAVIVTLIQPLAFFLPELGLKKLDSSTLCRNREIIQAYDNDPLVYRGKLSARLTLGLVSTMLRLESRVSHIRVPLLVMHGEADRLSLPEGSRIVFEKAGSKDKTLKLYPGFYHEILNEPEYIKVLTDIDSWLGQHN